MSRDRTYSFPAHPGPSLCVPMRSDGLGAGGTLQPARGRCNKFVQGETLRGASPRRRRAGYFIAAWTRAACLAEQSALRLRAASAAWSRSVVRRACPVLDGRRNGASARTRP
jgi:hypothetical protein